MLKVYGSLTIANTPKTSFVAVHISGGLMLTPQRSLSRATLYHGPLSTRIIGLFKQVFSITVRKMYAFNG